MAACSFLLSVGSVDELNGVCAEVRTALAGGGRLQAVPDHFREVAGDASARAACVEALEVEADPPDHVVRGVGSVAGEGVVDGEHEDSSNPLRQGVLDLRRVPFRPRVRRVTAETEVVLVAVEEPVPERSGTAPALAAVE